jgi:hypothetical protein
MMPLDLLLDLCRVVKKNAKLRNEANIFTMRFMNDQEEIQQWKQYEEKL